MPSAITVRLLMGDPLPMSVPGSVLDALVSLEITTAVGSASGFQLTLAAGKRSPLTRTLLPNGYFAAKTRVVAVASLFGATSVLLDGVILRHDVTAGNTPGESTLTLTGQDLTALMDLEVRSIGFPGQGPDVQVAQICAAYAQYGMSVQASPPPLPDVPNPVVRTPMQRMTDLAYVETLGRSVGYSFYLEPGPAAGRSTAHWGPESRTGTPQSALSGNFDAATNVESLTFSFDGRSRIRYVKDGAAAATPRLDEIRPQLSARPVDPLRQEPLPDVRKLDDTQTSLLATSLTATSLDAVTGAGELDVLRYGHVLQARRLVGVRGAGPAYDGTYYVTSVTHHVRRDSFRQSFRLVREGFGSAQQTLPP
jgi:hypothetical protein